MESIALVMICPALLRCRL